jgi:hypothetical protein
MYARVQSAHFSVMKVHSCQVVKCARSKCNRINLAPMFVPIVLCDATRLAVKGACVCWARQRVECGLTAVLILIEAKTVLLVTCVTMEDEAEAIHSIHKWISASAIISISRIVTHVAVVK